MKVWDGNKRGLTLAILLEYDDGPAMSPGDLSRILRRTPSVWKIRYDIKAKWLRATETPSSSGDRKRYRIEFADAKGYIRRLGLDEAA